MELEGEAPPPPYSEVDPATSTTPETSTMGGGDHSPSSTLRPTSSQSMRAPSFITLRGGYLRGVSFNDDVTTGTYFQERAFEFNPERSLEVVHREITADTGRNDLQFPGFDPDRNVTEHDWQTFVNYILTELGNETSVGHRKQLTPGEFHERQTKLEQIVMEWNEAFFQPRSIKFVAHYYYKHPQSPSSARRSRRSELVTRGLRRIPVEDGVIDTPQSEHGARTFGHHPPPFVHRAGPFANGLLGRHRGWSARAWVDPHNRHSDRQGGRRRASSSSSTSSSSSDSDANHRRGGRYGGRRGRREHRGEERRKRHDSTSSDSSFSSVSSISSDDMDEMDERSVGAVRQAIANFRLDPTNSQHNKLAYKQLIQQVRAKQREAIAGGDPDARCIRAAGKAHRKAIKDDLKSIRKEAKNIHKRSRDIEKAKRKEIKAAHKEAKNARKQARKTAKAVEKNARKAMKQAAARSQPDIISASQGNVSQASITTPAPPYHVPGSFPEAMSDEDQLEQQLQDLEFQIQQLETYIESVNESAEQDTKDITQSEKKKLARASYDEEIKEAQEEIRKLHTEGKTLREQISQNPGTGSYRRSRTAPPVPGQQSNVAYADYIGQRGEQFGRHIEALGQRFGRDMENWGENFGREMERWGQDFGRRVSQRGEQISRRFG